MGKQQKGRKNTGKPQLHLQFILYSLKHGIYSNCYWVNNNTFSIPYPRQGDRKWRKGDSVFLKDFESFLSWVNNGTLEVGDKYTYFKAKFRSRMRKYPCLRIESSNANVATFVLGQELLNVTVTEEMEALLTKFYQLQRKNENLKNQRKQHKSRPRRSVESRVVSTIPSNEIPQSSVAENEHCEPLMPIEQLFDHYDLLQAVPIIKEEPPEVEEITSSEYERLLPFNYEYRFLGETNFWGELEDNVPSFTKQCLMEDGVLPQINNRDLERLTDFSSVMPFGDTSVLEYLLSCGR